MTLPKLVEKYRSGEKLTMLTAYDVILARLVDEAGMDMVLVGDSLGMVIQGHQSTLPVTIEQMVYHTQCVARGIKKAHLMADMPFLSYQVDKKQAVKNAGLLIKAGAESVKIEGGEEMADTVFYLKKMGVPVMGHIGLKPQSIHTMGGYKIQGKSEKEAKQILKDAKVLQQAGVFSLLLEGIPAALAKKITQTVHVPTIGIGSGPFCSGQVLVIYDLLGANPGFKPRFVKQYLDLHALVNKAFKKYIHEVKEGEFPAKEHSFFLKK